MSVTNCLQPCSMCGSTEFSLVFVYDSPPDGETTFDFSKSSRSYHREIWQCRLCGHFVNSHQMDVQKLYQGKYVDATYGAQELLSNYQRIMALPPEQSDNYHRVKRIISYMNSWLGKQGQQEGGETTVLDVGSGLGVFPARMKEEGWECTALDPDPRVVEHIRRHIGVKVVCSDFLVTQDLGLYNLITFNKVLEHVPDPVSMLKKSQDYLCEDGLVYLEVPDGELAMTEGPVREEFFIEHLWVFSMTSLSLLAAQAGIVTQLIERIREPSGKYTLRAFLIRPQGKQK